jgi:hypothetical protein
VTRRRSVPVSATPTADSGPRASPIHQRAASANREVKATATDKLEPMKVETHAQAETELAVGGSFTRIGPSGVTVLGRMIESDRGGRRRRARSSVALVPRRGSLDAPRCRPHASERSAKRPASGVRVRAHSERAPATRNLQLARNGRQRLARSRRDLGQRPGGGGEDLPVPVANAARRDRLPFAG